MKARNLTMGLIAGAAIVGTAAAGEVGSVMNFSAGAPAKAVEVNSNFGALIAAINDNAKRIAALESPSSSVSGHSYTGTYTGTFLAAEVDAGDGERDYTAVEHFTGDFKLVFSGGDNTGYSNGADVAGAQIFTWPAGSPEYGVVEWISDEPEIPEQTNLVWSQTGNQVTVDLGEGELSLLASEDGSLLAGRFMDSGIENDPGDIWSTKADYSEIVTVILVRD